MVKLKHPAHFNTHKITPTQLPIHSIHMKLQARCTTHGPSSQLALDLTATNLAVVHHINSLTSKLFSTYGFCYKVSKRIIKQWKQDNKKQSLVHMKPWLDYCVFDNTQHPMENISQTIEKATTYDSRPTK